jgi:hypothetical protein
MNAHQKAPKLTSKDMDPEDASAIFALMDADIALIDMRYNLKVYAPKAKKVVDDWLAKLDQSRI